MESQQKAGKLISAINELSSSIETNERNSNSLINICSRLASFSDLQMDLTIEPEVPAEGQINVLSRIENFNSWVCSNNARIEIVLAHLKELL